MAGASYGGGIQLVSAALDKRIDAIAPTISWHSLLTSLFPDGNIKLGWVRSSSPPASRDRVRVVWPIRQPRRGGRIPTSIRSSRTGSQPGTTTQDDLDWMKSHGPGDLLQKIRVPTLLLQGTVDTLFPLDEAVANFREIGDNPLRTAALKGKGKKRKGKSRSPRGRLSAPSR